MQIFHFTSPRAIKMQLSKGFEVFGDANVMAFMWQNYE